MKHKRKRPINWFEIGYMIVGSIYVLFMAALAGFCLFLLIADVFGLRP